MCNQELTYYDVKLHLLGLRRTTTTPFTQYIEITLASVHDLAASRGILGTTYADVSILDKAYAGTELVKLMQENNRILLIPIKNKKGWEAVLKQRDLTFI